ncbi:hypothetical protein BH20CHL7_BH20CHL7_17300 [soil metagenome]
MHPDPAITTLCAARISVGLPIPSDLRVHSVYQSAINGLTPDGRLVTVATERVGGLPNGIVIAGDPDLAGLGIRPGMGVRLGQALRFESVGVIIRLDDAAPWSPRVPVLDVSRWPSRAVRCASLARRHRVAGGLEALAAAGSALNALAGAITRSDRVAALRAARGLIGLGPGLTPSGDDALAGVEAALHAVGHPVAGFLQAGTDDLETRTTTVSAAMLRHAASGDAAERVHRLLGALLSGPDEGLPDAIQAAVRWGATSGSDLLAGVVLALDAAALRVPATATATPTASARVAA